MQHSENVESHFDHFLKSIDKQVGFCLAFATLAGISVLYLASWQKGLATFSYFIILSGVLLRSRRHIHGIFMGSGVTLDIGLVLLLEFQRQAINTAMTEALSATQYIHLISSTLAALLYIPAITLGILRATGHSTKQSGRKTHIQLGIMAFVARTIGFLTMFSMVSV